MFGLIIEAADDLPKFFISTATCGVLAKDTKSGKYACICEAEGNKMKILQLINVSDESS